MDNSEVDLLQVMKIIWEKKNQILFYTVLIVVGAVSFSYIQPRYFETHKTAFIMPAAGEIAPFRINRPAEYYVKISRSPEILNAVLKNLPKEIKFDDNISPQVYLSSLLRVEPKVIKAWNAAHIGFRFTYFVRHTDPISAGLIANIWQKVLEDYFSKEDNNVISKNHNEKRLRELDMQLKLSTSKWEDAKRRLADFNDNYSINNKSLELASIKRIIEMAYYDSEDLVLQMDAANIHIAKSEEIKKYRAKKLTIEEKYLVAKETLSEQKRLLNLQPRTLELVENHATGTSKYENAKNNTILNPVFLKLQEEVIAGEVLLKTLDGQKNNLDKVILSLELDLSSNNHTDESPEFVQKKYQVKILANSINRFEGEARKLERQNSIKIAEFYNLTQEVVAFSDQMKKLKLLRNQKAIGLDFTASALEPAIFLGASLKRILFLSFGCGLGFMILVTLVRASFIAQKDN